MHSFLGSYRAGIANSEGAQRANSPSSSSSNSIISPRMLLEPQRDEFADQKQQESGMSSRQDERGSSNHTEQWSPFVLRNNTGHTLSYEVEGEVGGGNGNAIRVVPPGAKSAFSFAHQMGRGAGLCRTYRAPRAISVRLLPLSEAQSQSQSQSYSQLPSQSQQQEQEQAQAQAQSFHSQQQLWETVYSLPANKLGARAVVSHTESHIRENDFRVTHSPT